MRRVVRGSILPLGLLAVLALGACGEHHADAQLGWQPAGTWYVAGWQPCSVALGDFDGDRRVDLVVADTNDGRVYFLKGLGRAQFVAQPAVPILGPPGEQLVRAGDLDGDEQLDLVLLELGTGTVRSYFGDGGGGFVEAAPAPALDGLESGLLTAHLASIDGDGLTDLLALDELGDVVAFLGNGDGSFSPAGGGLHLPYEEILEEATALQAGLPPALRDAAAQDLTGDGLLDVVVAVPDAGEVRVFLGQHN